MDEKLEGVDSRDASYWEILTVANDIILLPIFHILEEELSVSFGLSFRALLKFKKPYFELYI